MIADRGGRIVAQGLPSETRICRAGVVRCVVRHVVTVLLWIGESARLRGCFVHFGLFKDIEDSLEILTEKPGIGSLTELGLFALVAKLLPTLLVLQYLLLQELSIARLGQLLQGLVIAQVVIVLLRGRLHIDEFHGNATSRIPILLSLQLILQLHDLVSGGAANRLVDKASIEELINERIRNFHVSNRHAHNILLSARMLLVLVGPFERIFLDHEVVEAAAEGPDIDRRRHLALVFKLALLREEFRRRKWKMACKIFTFEELKIVVG